jgi:hypothetical protein
VEFGVLQQQDRLGILDLAGADHRQPVFRCSIE